MTVYLLHLKEPLPRGTSKKGTQLQAGHYIGEAEDLIERILQHAETTWERLPEPEVLEDGRIRKGKKHGPGATFMGVVNAMGKEWKLARTWPGAGRDWESYLKSLKCAPKLCPDCNPNAHRYANKIFI